MIRKFAAWNGFPKYIVNKIIKNVNQNNDPPEDIQNQPDKNEQTTIWLRLNYAGPTGTKIANDLKRRLRFCLKKNANVVYKVIYSTHKLSYFTNMKTDCHRYSLPMLFTNSPVRAVVLLTLVKLSGTCTNGVLNMALLKLPLIAIFLLVQHFIS